MNNIAFIYSGKPKGLQSLPFNVDAVKESLEYCEIWDIPIHKELTSLGSFESDLTNHITTEVDNLLIYYTGHADSLDPEKKELSLILDEPRLIQELFNAIFQNRFIHVKRTKVAIVLDACFSEKFIHEVESWTNNLEILVSSSKHSPSTEENANSNLSLFSHYFTKALKSLPKGHKKANLDNIRQDINWHIKEYEPIKQYAFYKHPVLTNIDEPMVLSYKDTTSDVLQNIINDLKQYFSEENIDEDDIKLYATNLLGFSSIRLPNTFDEVVKYLFNNYKEVLILILDKIDDTTLNVYIDDLLKFLRKDREDIKSFLNYNVDMTQDRTNLLITLTSNGKDALSDVNVQILEYKQNKIATNGTSFRVNLNSDDGKIAFIDAIVKITEQLGRKNVLIEFILPSELIDLNIASWKGSDNRVLKVKVIRRLWLRIEKSRVAQGISSDWKDVWQYYQNKASLPLCNVMTNEVEYDEFEKTPYLRLPYALSLSTYNDLVAESACIVLAPLKSEQKDAVDGVCQNLTDIELKQLLKESTKEFKRAKVPYLLIWDNPNRLPTKPAEVQNNQHKSVLGA